MPDQPSLSTQTANPDLQKLPPSAKLVAKLLEYEGNSTPSELADLTLLPPRTVRHALTLLQEQELVSSEISFMDARQRIYTLEVERD
ncbi:MULTISPECIES: MarR family transcriptional regulator [Salinibaculum]|uniref:MarR family transcriptional regulator n=1 Tax=Salinibaculum TaxID=2732368 RepID=UPI0030D12170